MCTLPKGELVPEVPSLTKHTCTLQVQPQALSLFLQGTKYQRRKDPSDTFVVLTSVQFQRQIRH